MFTELVLASGNKGKLAEYQRLLDGLEIQIQSMKEYPEIGEIVEDGSTFTENALIKARTVCQATGKAALADDSGLIVDAWMVHRESILPALLGRSAVMPTITRKCCI